MKKTGQCPKCKSTDVVTNEDMTKHGERSVIMISAFKNIRVSNYICLNCGLIEEHIAQKSMQDSGKMDKIRANWKKYLPNH